MYPKNTSSEELVNTSSLIYNRKYLYQNKTKSICYFDKNIYLFFNNVSREHNFTYDLTLKINAFVDYNILNEEFLVYTIKLNLTDIGNKPAGRWPPGSSATRRRRNRYLFPFTQMRV